MKRDSGFTLIELLVVISIIGLLSSVVMAGLTNARARGRVASGLTMANNIYSAYGLDAEIFLDFNDYYSVGNPSQDRTGKWTGFYFDYSATSPVTDTPNSSYGISFDNANEYLIVRLRATNQAANITLNDVVTVTAWMKTTTAGNLPIFSNRLGGGGTYFGVNDGKFYVSQNNIAPNQITETNSVVNDGKWHFLVWTSDGSNSALYVDGKLDKKETKFFRGNAGVANIGRNPANTSEYFLGSIDDFAIYNDRTLLASEVQELYLASLSEHISVVE